MSFNLLELAQGAIGKQVLGSIGGILGEDEKTTSSAISAGLPALIGGLINKSSTSAGANDLFGLLDKQDDGILDDLGGLLGGGNHESFLGQGSGLLGTLLGANQSGLIRLLCKATGLGDGKIATVLSILAPIVMGLLKRQRKTANLDAGGLGGLLKGQQRHISSSLPAGVGDLFEIGGGSTGSSRQAAQPASNGSLFSKLLPLIVILGLAIAGFKYFTGRNKGPVDDGGGTVVVPNDGLPTESGLGDISPTETGSGITIQPGPLSTEAPANRPQITLEPATGSNVEIEPGPLSP